MDTVIWPRRGLLGSPCLAVVLFSVTLAAARPVPEGQVLVNEPGGPGHALVDLRSGQRTALPRSAFSRHYGNDKDQWSADTLHGELVRVDEGGHVEFFDRGSLRRTGGFDLAVLPGTDAPKLYSPLKPSRDGHYLLGYWKGNYREDEPSLVVFDRHGKVVQSHPRLKQHAGLQRAAFDWLPNNQFVYVLDDKLVLGQIGNWTLGAAVLPLPPGAEADGELAVSPDAKHIVVSLSRPAGSPSVFFKTLYLAGLNGSGLLPLTAVRNERGGEPVRQAHTSPQWSPSGRWIAFGGNQKMGDWGGQYTMRCEPLLVVPADGNQVPIHAVKPDDETRLVAPSPTGRGQRALGACGGTVQWIAR